MTGASSGIGRAIALALAASGARIYAIGRNAERLAETVRLAQAYAPAEAFEIDLAAEESFRPLVAHIGKEAGLDVLVHAAGAACVGLMTNASVETLDLQYFANVRGPYALTQRLLPKLAAVQGQIVFLNSSVGLAAKRADVGQYAATKHAARAIADSLREEVNPKGIRVLSLYLGRTATPMQESLCKQEGKPYSPESFMKPEEVASVVVRSLMLPPTVEITDISMRPLKKAW